MYCMMLPPLSRERRRLTRLVRSGQLGRRKGGRKVVEPLVRDDVCPFHSEAGSHLTHADNLSRVRRSPDAALFDDDAAVTHERSPGLERESSAREPVTENPAAAKG